jgi:hypothetical protein
LNVALCANGYCGDVEPKRVTICANVTQGPTPEDPHVAEVQLFVSAAHVVVFCGSMYQLPTVQAGPHVAAVALPPLAPRSTGRLTWGHAHFPSLRVQAACEICSGVLVSFGGAGMMGGWVAAGSSRRALEPPLMVGSALPASMATFPFELAFGVPAPPSTALCRAGAPLPHERERERERERSEDSQHPRASHHRILHE